MVDGGLIRILVDGSYLDPILIISIGSYLEDGDGVLSGFYTNYFYRILPRRLLMGSYQDSIQIISIGSYLEGC